MLSTVAMAPWGESTRDRLIGSTITCVIWLCYIEMNFSEDSNKSRSDWSRPASGGTKMYFVVTEATFGQKLQKRGQGKVEDPPGRTNQPLDLPVYDANHLMSSIWY